MKLNSIMVIRPGTLIKLTEGVPAVIDEVSIGATGHIQYLCVWWAGRERKREWLNNFEVIEIEHGDQYISIGFKP